MDDAPPVIGIDHIRFGENALIDVQDDAIAEIANSVNVRRDAGGQPLLDPLLHLSRREGRVVVVRFEKLKRLLVPTPSTLISVGRACHRLRSSGKLDPVHPKHYNEISIASLARQIGATVITHNTRDFSTIQSVMDFEVELP